ncbi:MAG TPA: dienelactone hydrolase family protein [Solirubrobacteraceae bacterium]|jgi:carboxymethylenebutenolidase
MSGEMVEVKTQDGVADAYLAKPDDGERHPGVLFLMDAFGLRPRIEEMVERIAAQGFAVLAPNVFYRDARSPIVPVELLNDPERRPQLYEKIMPLMQGLTAERIVSDGGAYLDRLEQEGVGPVAITGYCLGGRVGWRIATAYPRRVAALAGFHAGGLVSDDEQSPHRSASELQAEIYLGHADNDQSMTPENIATLEQALSEVGVTYRSELYEGAAHGYTMSDTAAYDEAAAERHFDELFSLLQRTVAA